MLVWSLINREAIVHLKYALICILLAALACSSNDDDDDDTVTTNDDDDTTSTANDDDDTTDPHEGLEIVYGNPSFIDVMVDGRLVLRHAWAEAQVEVGTGMLTVAPHSGCAAAWEEIPATELLSNTYYYHLEGMRTVCTDNGLRMTWSVYRDTLRDAVVTTLDIANLTGSEVRVWRMTPLMTEGEGGGLFTGGRLADARVLDNGSNVALDVEAIIHYPDEARFGLLDGLLEVPPRGNTVSNWNAAVNDIATGTSIIIGALGVERALPTFGFVGSLETPATEGSQQGFSAFYADQPMLFVGKPLADGESLSGEAIYFDPNPDDAWEGLESYADAIAEWQKIEIWTKRNGGQHVPNGWNSWTGSGGTGGLGTNINEEIIGQCMEVMAREFNPYGIDWYQIDDGYQIASGDWEVNPDRFPSGMPAFSAAVEAAGMSPGIWINNFLVEKHSSLYAEHPEWMSDPDDNVIGALLNPGDNAVMLDLSNEEALDWIRTTMRRYRDEWGMKWIKHDFAYYAMTHIPRSNPRLTSIEAYKQGLRAMREGMGPDVFYLGIAIMGVNYGIVDSMRLTLDNGPRWEEDEPFALIGEGQSFKATVKTGSKRYWLHNRVWITHNDLLFFRTDTEQPEPPVTLDEAKTFASFISLSGSLVKFGEDLRTLTPEQINVWRQLLPSYPDAGRPLDLFTRLYPEVWRYDINGTMGTGPMPSGEAKWTLAGLLNWGRNYDYTTQPPTEMPDEARTYTVPLEKLGLDPGKTYLAREFWTGELLGEVTGSLTHTVAAHGHAVIALREKTGAPQFLGTNRHITQGATDWISETWDGTAKTLTLALHADAGGPEAVPFEYQVDHFVPDGFVLNSGSPNADWSQAGPVVRATFTPGTSGTMELVLQFQ